jgi:hypothetical protein
MARTDPRPFTQVIAGAAGSHATSVARARGARPERQSIFVASRSLVILVMTGGTITGNSEPDCFGFSDPACGP